LEAAGAKHIKNN